MLVKVLLLSFGDSPPQACCILYLPFCHYLFCQSSNILWIPSIFCCVSANLPSKPPHIYPLFFQGTLRWSSSSTLFLLEKWGFAVSIGRWMSSLSLSFHWSRGSRTSGGTVLAPIRAGWLGSGWKMLREGGRGNGRLTRHRKSFGLW